MPAQHLRRRDIPLLLGLQHEQRAGDDEARSADDLGKPVHAVLRGNAGQPVEDRWQGGDAGDPEDRGPDHLREAGQEADFLEVVRAKLVPGRPPRPCTCVFAGRLVDVIGLVCGVLAM